MRLPGLLRLQPPPMRSPAALLAAALPAVLALDVLARPDGGGGRLGNVGQTAVGRMPLLEEGAKELVVVRRGVVLATRLLVAKEVPSKIALLGGPLDLLHGRNELLQLSVLPLL